MVDAAWFCKLRGIGGHEWRRVAGDAGRLRCGYCGAEALIVFPPRELRPKKRPR